jgi:hypothetical protein
MNIFVNKNRQAPAAEKNTSASKPFFQAKLSINNSNDKFEHEADAVADKVMRMETPSLQKKSTTDSFFSATPISITPVQRKCAHCENEEKIQRKEIDGEEMTADNNLENYVGGLSSSGQPLPNEVRNFYEPLFGYDFSNVKVHTDAVAAKSAQSINALAYTSGSNIVFNNAQYSPNTDSGKRLLGHELTHVVQQNKSIQTKAIQRQSVSPSVTPVPTVVRQNVCYIMGNDAFYRAATRFFRARFPNAVFVSDKRNLEAVLTHLNATFTLPLGNIFIVSHANEDGTLAFGLNAADRDRHLGVVELRNALHPTGGGNSSLTNVSHLIDVNTRIQIKGCDLGRNQEVVELFDEAFGGAGVVTAPTHEQAYSFNTAEIREGTEDAMRSHMTEFESGLPALPPAPARVPRGLRGDALRLARAEYDAARRLRAAALAVRTRAISTERRTYRTEAARLGSIAGTHEALSGPMFQRMGNVLYTIDELQPQIDGLYPHLSNTQRIDLAERLAAPDRRSASVARSQGVFRQSGQRAYSFSTTFTYTAPQNFSEAAIAFARLFRNAHFTAQSLTSITPVITGTTTVYEYAFAGNNSRRGLQAEQMTYTATSAPVESNEALIAQIQAQVNNPDKFSWTVNESRSAGGQITKNVVRERVVAYLHHGSLNASRNEYFIPPETDRRFFAESTI